MSRAGIACTVAVCTLLTGACDGGEVRAPGASPSPTTRAAPSSVASPDTGGPAHSVASPDTGGPAHSVASPSEPATAASPSAGPPTATPGRPVCQVPARFEGADLERLPVSARSVALTFDAGASDQGVAPILGTLARLGVPATFFVTGDFVRSFPRSARRIGRLHLVGNHTDTHADLTTLTAQQVGAELRRAQAAIRRGTGQDPRRFFRFPFGARDARTIAAVNDRCYVAFRWTVDTLGWKGTSGGMTASTVARRVLAAAQPGAIVLMHAGANPEDRSTLDADALPAVIGSLRARGYGFVRLSAVMSAAP